MAKAKLTKLVKFGHLGFEDADVDYWELKLAGELSHAYNIGEQRQWAKMAEFRRKRLYKEENQEKDSMESDVKSIPVEKNILNARVNRLVQKLKIS